LHWCSVAHHTYYTCFYHKIANIHRTYCTQDLNVDTWLLNVDCGCWMYLMQKMNPRLSVIAAEVFCGSIY
jgi:hypothetical protein